MKKTIFMKITSLSLLLAFLLLISCEEKEDIQPDHNTKIKAVAFYDQTNLKKSSFSGSEIVLESFMIVMEEIEFEFEDDDKEIMGEDYASDIELDGPFELELMDNGESLEEIIATVNLPHGDYDEVEFEIETGKDPGSEMFEKSIMAKGSLNGTPFVFWTDGTDDFELEFEGNNKLTIDGVKEAIVTLSFDLSKVFDVHLIGIDLSGLSDVDGDGTIEINPYSDDDFSELSDDLWERFKDSMEAWEEYNDQDDDDDDNDENDDDDDQNDDDQNDDDEDK